jgi:hypothetical protein
MIVFALLAMFPSALNAQKTEIMAQEGLELISEIRGGDSSIIGRLTDGAIRSDVSASGHLGGDQSQVRPFELSKSDLVGLLNTCDVRRFEATSGAVNLFWVCDRRSDWLVGKGQRGRNADCYDQAFKLTFTYGFGDPVIFLDHANFWNSERCADRVEPIVFPPAPQKEGS